MKDTAELRFTLDGVLTSLHAPPDTPLVILLRENLARTGTKLGCAIGRCGACTVLVDGAAMNACLLMAWQVQGRDVVTIEGLRDDPAFAPLLDALAESNAFQCGYCAPGVTMALAGLFTAQPDPDDETITTALEGHICRCTGYASILAGARHGAQRMKGAR
jgi:carbon-monoxide dehydrogenase small subunit